jgi:hypothetical protein
MLRRRPWSEDRRYHGVLPQSSREQVSEIGKDVSTSEPADEQAAAGRLLDLVRSFVTTHVAWKPLFIGAVITVDDRMRLYFRSPERDRTYGVDVLISRTGPGLLGALVSPVFLANEHMHPPSDDPHCDVVVDLTDY